MKKGNRDYALGRMKAGRLNKTEQEYDDTLKLRMLAGEIKWYRFEGITLKLADNTRYTPDFVVMDKDGYIECHEVKGFWRDDAKVKVKVANELYPFKFLIIKKLSRKRGWDITEI